MILENGDSLFKSLNQYRLLGVDDLPRTVNIYLLYMLIYYSSQHHKTLYFQMKFISIRCSNKLRESIKSELVLNRPKQCITKKRKLENSQAP